MADAPFGLPNLGFTCHVNAIVQCMLAIATYRDLMVRLGDPLKVLQLSTSADRTATYRELLKRFQAVVKPIHILEHNDAHEIMHLTNRWMHERSLRNRGSGSAPPPVPPPSTAAATATAAAIAALGRSYLSANESLASRTVFAVTFAKVRCGHCDHTNVNFEHASEFRLTVADRSVDDALKEYFSPSKIPDWVCDECRRTHPDSSRTVHLWTAPKVVVILLDKMRYDERGATRSRIPVDLPKRLRIRGIATPKRAAYNLKAVCEHRGSTTRGHYTATIARDGAWFAVDDTAVSPVPGASREDAYMLFYEAAD